MESSTTQGLESVIKEIEEAETQVAGRLASLKRLKDRLARARKDLSGGSPVSGLTTLIADLKGLPATVVEPDPSALAGRLTSQLKSLSEAYGTGFRDSLRRACESQGMPFKVHADSASVGPFDLVVDPVKESATLAYAKVPVVKGLPLEAAAVVKTVQEAAAKLLQPVAFSGIAAQFDEAMRVALARQKRPSPRGEMRVDLPAVFREMSFIRGGGKSGEYTLPRFVVELKSLVQADENMRRDHRFRLESAVIDNAKDPRKSVFVPNDLSAGHGEGSYYQAILLVGPT